MIKKAQIQIMASVIPNPQDLDVFSMSDSDTEGAFTELARKVVTETSGMIYIDLDCPWLPTSRLTIIDLPGELCRIFSNLCRSQFGRLSPLRHC